MLQSKEGVKRCIRVKRKSMPLCGRQHFSLLVFIVLLSVHVCHTFLLMILGNTEEKMKLFCLFCFSATLNLIRLNSDNIQITRIF